MGPPCEGDLIRGSGAPASAACQAGGPWLRSGGAAPSPLLPGRDIALRRDGMLVHAGEPAGGAQQPGGGQAERYAATTGDGRSGRGRSHRRVGRIRRAHRGRGRRFGCDIHRRFGSGDDARAAADVVAGRHAHRVGRARPDGTSAEVMTAGIDGTEPTDTTVAAALFYLSWDPTSSRIVYLGGRPPPTSSSGSSTWPPARRRRSTPAARSTSRGRRREAAVGPRGDDRPDTLALDGTFTPLGDRPGCSALRCGPRTDARSSTSRWETEAGNGSSPATWPRTGAKRSRGSTAGSRSS